MEKEKKSFIVTGASASGKTTLIKQLYDATYANKEYKENLIETKFGVVINQNEINNLNDILVSLIFKREQSIHKHI